MKSLFIVTGRGLGGDAMVAINLIKEFEKKGVQCEIALDESAYGTVFEKNGYSWHKISIPQAGGHAATKLSAAKGALKLISATFKARSLIRRLNVDFVVGVLGGGAIVASVGSKFARKPCFSLISIIRLLFYNPNNHFNQSNKLPVLPVPDKYITFTSHQ